ncbi:MAG: hypothetical protein Q7K57_34895 [Burkholderiaceae bacterium]|nr:hypothetical protein [Burkholderiaceae bacterium]
MVATKRQVGVAWLVRKPMVRKVDAQGMACTQNAGSLVRKTLVRWYACKVRMQGTQEMAGCRGIDGAVASKKPIRAGWYEWAVREETGTAHQPPALPAPKPWTTISTA